MKALQKYKRTYILALQNAMEYRTDFLMGIISGGFIILVQCFLWTAVFRSSPQEIINGYTYSQIIIYSVLSGVVSKLVSAGFEGEIANDIKTGGLSKFIAQPIHYFSYRICNFFGEKTVQTGVVLILFVILMTVFTQIWGFQLRVGQIVMFLVSILFGMLINFLLFIRLVRLHSSLLRFGACISRSTKASICSAAPSFRLIFSEIRLPQSPAICRSSMSCSSR